MSASSTPLSPRAEVLKAEGNQLFNQGEWSQAFIMYSNAISAAPQNAVLYSNRSATAIKMGNYKHALLDAKKAVELDPNWEKAYGRLAAAHDALGETPDACDAYKQAAKLAKSASIKSDYEKRAEDILDKVTKTAQANLDRAIRASKDMERPRDKYLRLIQEGHHFPLDSAAVRNVNCIDNVLQGWKALQQLQIFETDPSTGQPWPGDRTAFRAVPGAVSDWVASFTMDPTNGFAYEADERWANPVDLMKKNVNAEASAAQLPMNFESMSALDIINHYDAIVARLGWATPIWQSYDPKLSLALVIRIPIVQGILNEFVAHDYGTAAKNYERSIALLDLGRSRWRGLSTGLIGTSFEETFRRAIASRYMQCLQHRAGTRPKPLLSELDEIKRVANEQLESCDKEPCHLLRNAGLNPIMTWLAFYKVIRAEAHMALAYVFRQTGEGPEDLLTCLEHYLKAAAWFPFDDTRCAQNIWYAIDIAMKIGGLSLVDVDAMIAKAKASEQAAELYFEPTRDNGCRGWILDCRRKLAKAAREKGEIDPSRVFVCGIKTKRTKISPEDIDVGSESLGKATLSLVGIYQGTEEKAKHEVDGVLALNVD